ncbi:MAG TPA: 3' terminal RNA ribose 2'-O-methyltransferase Hen1 [Candidatus Angelobacter sp.]|nr:3' terminal RNA ribose 2'-O-methyltransferase Hen1 [Candidatus Angelobacter sp.]
MLLTITSHQTPATDLGYLLHKNPAHVQSFDLSFGKAYVFYPEASEENCTAALLLDIDPVGLVRRRRGPSGEGGTLDQYVNDRPYAASSFMSVAIAQVFGTAMGGKSRDRQQLAETPIPLTAKIAVLPCKAGVEFISKLFEPLGYEVQTQGHILDGHFPEWGESRYYTVKLKARVRLQDLLTHLYVLIPVLDADKHYWIGDDEVEKLLRHGEDWLATHPEKEVIVRRYLKHRHHLAREALNRLADEDESDPDRAVVTHAQEELAIEKPLKLWEQRLGAVVSVLKASEARRILDLGCGEGRLLAALLEDRHFSEIVGMDVSFRSLEIASDRLHLDRLPPAQQQRIRLIHGSLMYKDKRLSGFDAACVVEVIEHLDPPRLAAFELVLFGHARPKQVVITTPNAEYNVRFETLPAGQFRHKDHRFEWTRQQFQNWAEGIAARFGYTARFLPVGPEDAEVGPPTQMGVFTL